MCPLKNPPPHRRRFRQKLHTVLSREKRYLLMELLKKLNTFSLHMLTLAGVAAVASLAVNIISALVMFAVESLDKSKREA